MPQINISKIHIFHRDAYPSSTGLITTPTDEITTIIDPKFTDIENKAEDFFKLKPRRFTFSVNINDNTFFDAIGTNLTAHPNFPNLTNYLLRCFDSSDNQIFEGIISIDSSYSEDTQDVEVTVYDPIVLFADTNFRLATSLLESTYKDPYDLQKHIFDNILSEYFTSSVNTPDYSTDWTIPDWGLGDFRDVYDWEGDINQFYLDIRNTYINSAKSYFATFGETLASTHDFSKVEVYRWRNHTKYLQSYAINPGCSVREVAVEFMGVVCFVSSSGRKYICLYHKGYVHNWLNVLTGTDTESFEMNHNSTAIEELYSTDGNGVDYEAKPLFFCNYFASNVNYGRFKVEYAFTDEYYNPSGGYYYCIPYVAFLNPFIYPDYITATSYASIDDNDIPIPKATLYDGAKADVEKDWGELLNFNVLTIEFIPILRYSFWEVGGKERTLNWMTWNADKYNDYVGNPTVYSPENLDSYINNAPTIHYIKSKGDLTVQMKGDLGLVITQKYTTFNYNSAYGDKRSQDSLFTKGQINIDGDNTWALGGWSTATSAYNHYITAGTSPMAFYVILFFLYQINYDQAYPLTQANMDDKPLFKRGNISQSIGYLPSDVISRDAFSQTTPDYDYDVPSGDPLYFKLSELLQFFLASMNLYCYYTGKTFTFVRSFLASAGTPITIEPSDIIDWQTQTEEYSEIDTENVLKPTLNYVPNALDPYYNAYAALDNKRATCKISRLFADPDYGITINSVLSISSVNWRVEKLNVYEAYYDVTLTKYITDPI